MAALHGCTLGSVVRYESARPETATVLAGSITTGIVHGEDTERVYVAYNEVEEVTRDAWDALYPYVTFTAWWRWALTERLELSTGLDLDLGSLNALSGGGGVKVLLTPTDAGHRVHLALSAAGGLTSVFHGLLLAWVEGGLPLTLNATARTRVTLRPQVRYRVEIPTRDEASVQMQLLAGGSLAVRTPCAKAVDCVYELVALVPVPLDAQSDSGERPLFLSFGVGAVF